MDSSRQELFFKVGQVHQERISNNPDQYKNQTGIFGLAHQAAQISEEFLSLNPTFLPMSPVNGV